MVQAAAKKKKRTAKRSGVLALFLVIAILVLATAIVLIQFPLSREGEKPELAKQDQVAGAVAFDLAAVDANATYAFGSNLLLKIQDSSFSILNLKGLEEYKVDATVVNPSLIQAGDKLLLVEKQGYQFFVLGQDRLLLRGKTEAPILGFTMSDSGALSFVLEKDGTKGIVRVLKPNGDKWMELTVQDNKDSGYVLSTHFNADSTALYVSMLNVAGASPLPVINCYSLEPQLLGRIQAQYKPEVNEALPLVFPLAGGNLLCAGASKLLEITPKKMEPVLPIVSFAQGGMLQNDFYFVASNNPSGPYFLNICNPNSFPSKLESGYQLPEVPRFLAHAGNYLVCLVGDDLYRFNASRPNNPDVFPFLGKLLRFSVDNRGNILCVCSDGIRKIVN